MHSLGRELIVTEMHQSPARLHVRVLACDFVGLSASD